MKLICPTCKMHYFDTTELYDPDILSHGAMFKFREEQYPGWTVFPQNDDMTRADLECPGCGSLLCDAPDWIVEVEGSQKAKEEDGRRNPEKVPCPYCNELFSEGGMHFHVKAKHPENLLGKEDVPPVEDQDLA